MSATDSTAPTTESTTEFTTDSTTAPTSTGRKRRKVREGLVASTKMDSTIIVEVTERVRHRQYAKTVRQTKRLYVHDGDNEAREGDRVRIMETRPLSRTKRWRLIEIVERAR